MSVQPKPFLTPDQYLEIERAAEFKSEYFDGEMFAMAGATEAHNLITVNVIGELRQQLKGRPCRTYASDMRVWIAKNGLYTYPDVVIVCGEPRFKEDRRDNLLNPTVLVEVLSPSTEAYDRGGKFALYRQLPSLQEYVLIAQDKRHIERYARQPDGSGWLLSEASGEEGSLFLPAIGCRLALSEVYDRVEFAAVPAQDSGKDAAH